MRPFGDFLLGFILASILSFGPGEEKHVSLDEAIHYTTLFSLLSCRGLLLRGAAWLVLTLCTCSMWMGPVQSSVVPISSSLKVHTYCDMEGQGRDKTCRSGVEARTRHLVDEAQVRVDRVHVVRRGLPSDSTPISSHQHLAYRVGDHCLCPVPRLYSQPWGFPYASLPFCWLQIGIRETFPSCSG